MSNSKYVSWVYAITINNRIYVGVSDDVRTRYMTHINSLKKNKHENKAMQKAFNEANGEFSFEVLEEVPRYAKYIYEFDWIYRLGTYLYQYGFNMHDLRFFSPVNNKPTKTFWAMQSEGSNMYSPFWNPNKDERKIFNTEVIVV